MFEEKYGINPKHLALWTSIYLITVIPTYQILYHQTILLFFVVIAVENVMTYYVFQDDVLEDLMQSIDGGLMTLFMLSMLAAIIFFLNLMFNDLELFGMLCIIEVVGFFLTRLIRQFKEQV